MGGLLDLTHLVMYANFHAADVAILSVDVLIAISAVVALKMIMNLVRKLLTRVDHEDDVNESG